jgi:hypothetical protein
MKSKNLIDQQILVQAIRKGYGLEITDIKFLLRGFGGDCYRAETSTRTSYFLKLHDPINNQMTAASSRAFYLPLMQQLHTKNILPNIPHLLPKLDGTLSLGIGDNELVITNFITGELVGFGELPELILVQLAEQVGILHNCRDQLEFEYPFIDQFEIVFEQDLLDSFDRLVSLPEPITPGQSLLRESILPHQAQLITHLNRLKQLQAYARKTNKFKVVCHTDIHGGNLMTNKQGNLYILDWENALIAPPEHDLFFFAGEPNFREIFWPHYTRSFEVADLDLNMLRFYFYRRGLEDIADFILRILHRDGDPERDQQEIQWMMECITGMEQIEDTVSKLESNFGV